MMYCHRFGFALRLVSLLTCLMPSIVAYSHDRDPYIPVSKQKPPDTMSPNVCMEADTLMSLPRTSPMVFPNHHPNKDGGLLSMAQKIFLSPSMISLICEAYTLCSKCGACIYHCISAAYTRSEVANAGKSKTEKLNDHILELPH